MSATAVETARPDTRAPLSEELRTHTAAAHSAAEESTFVAELMAGALDEAALAGLLAQSLVIYRAMEGSLARHAGGRQLGGFIDPKLERVPALEADMAHHYVRYMGDLSGGQIISRMVQRHYGVADAGLNFYAFPQIPKPKPYKDAYRDRLDATDFTPDQKDAILAFAAESFELNRAVFVDLAAERVRALAA